MRVMDAGRIHKGAGNKRVQQESFRVILEECQKEVRDMRTIKVIIAKKEEIWFISADKPYFCPMHGACPSIIKENGFKQYLGIEPMFFCEECGMVKKIDVWNNSSGLCDAKVSLPPQPKGGFAIISECCGSATWHRPEYCPNKKGIGIPEAI